jgi:hypothetical protein
MLRLATGNFDIAIIVLGRLYSMLSCQSTSPQAQSVPRWCRTDNLVLHGSAKYLVVNVPFPNEVSVHVALLCLVLDKKDYISWVHERCLGEVVHRENSFLGLIKIAWPFRNRNFPSEPKQNFGSFHDPSVRGERLICSAVVAVPVQ